jgi:hypothetical protein
MQFPRRPNSDRSPESLESRLRALPPRPVPGDLEARLLAAIPAEESNAVPRWARASRPRRLAVWAGAAGAVAAACLLAVLLSPGPGSEMAVPNLAVNSERSQPAHQVTAQQPADFLSIMPWLEARRDLDGAERPLFTWPIQEKSPLMVSSALRPDLLD